MKKRTRLALYFLLGCLAFYGSGRVYFVLTDGFNPGDLASAFTYRDNLTFPSDSPEEIAKVNLILRQKFSYLGKGGQTYALVSEDQRYILKIVKQKHHRFNIAEEVLFQLPFTENWENARTQRISKRLQEFLSSCLLCYEELPEESRLLYVHFLPTQNMPQKALIVDNLGFTHEVDLNTIDFMLQEKAETVEAKIRSLVEKGDYGTAKEALQNIINLLVTCSKKGIMDTDPAILQNVGFVGNQAMFMDVGRIVKNKKIKEDPGFYQGYMSSHVEGLNAWARANFPQLSDISLTFSPQASE